MSDDDLGVIDCAMCIPASSITYWILPNSKLLQRSHIRSTWILPNPFSTRPSLIARHSKPDLLALRSSDGQTFVPL